MLKSLWQKILDNFGLSSQEKLQPSSLSVSHVINDIEDFEPSIRINFRIVDQSPLSSNVFSLRSLHEKNELLKALEAILTKQDEDAEMRTRESWHYGPTGKWVRYAAWDARDAVRGSLDEALASNSLNPIIQAVLEAKESYCKIYDDDDGYGAGTFGDILNDLRGLQARLGEAHGELPADG